MILHLYTPYVNRRQARWLGVCRSGGHHVAVVLVKNGLRSCDDVTQHGSSLARIFLFLAHLFIIFWFRLSLHFLYIHVLSNSVSLFISVPSEPKKTWLGRMIRSSCQLLANVRLQLACIESLMQDNTHARSLTTGQLDHVVSGV